ncbi:MAG: mechanosensitive ion channel [Candidatus Methanoplasma sp.]|jgi:small-conductance mechanosensitive channel|nr:mechanosensitive ion channel [Candidatus Methanoplasma sp.]
MRKAAALAIALLAVAGALALCAASEDAYAASSDATVTPFGESMEISAGGTASIKLAVVNEASGLRMITVCVGGLPDGIAKSMSRDPDFLLKEKDIVEVTLTLKADKYASSGTFSLKVWLNIQIPGSDEPAASTEPRSISVHVSSRLSSEEDYNKIMGVFDNRLPAPFDGPASTALITFLLWMLVCTVIIEMILPFMVWVIRGDKDERGRVKREVRKLAIAMLLFSLSRALRAYGADEEVIGNVETWFSVLYVVIGAYIAWRLYLVLVAHIIGKREKSLGEVDLEPVMRLFGKLAIGVSAVAMAMSAMGFNLTWVVTSAGIASLGITLGAQNILSQFFSGIVILATHPFKTGDMVRIGASSSTYVVKSVNIMNTVFANWDNEEDVIMPNNAVSSATITNITKNDMTYKIYVYFGVAYGTDLDKAKRIMIDAAMASPLVVTDGTSPMPATRLTSLDASSVTLRLAAHVKNYNNYARAEGQLREDIYRGFRENGIEIPFPQLDVRIRGRE